MIRYYYPQAGSSQDRLKKVGYFTPTFLDDETMATVSPHTGRPVLMKYDKYYEYWNIERLLTREEVVMYLGESYVKNM